MRSNRMVVITASLLFFRIGCLSAAEPVDDKKVRQILQDAMDAGRSSGIVAGIIDASGSRVISLGKTDADGTDLNGDSVFEIGSVTTTFTAALLADMIERREVYQTDPIMIYLPPSVRVPMYGKADISLLDLVTHSSGLPRFPGNFVPKNPANPYADYSIEQMYEYLSSYVLSRPIGGRYEYSNFGYALLGQALALRHGKDFRKLTSERVFQPLGMTNTGFDLSPVMKSRLALGHNRALKSVLNWDYGAFAPAAGAYSTVNDMLLYLAANLGLKKTTIAMALERAQQIRGMTTVKDTAIAFAWHVFRSTGGEIHMLNGETGGYHGFVGFDRKSGVGIVILSNCATSIDDIGLHLLNPQAPLLKFTPRKEIKLDPSVLDALVGKYQAPGMIFLVSKENNALYLKPGEQPSVALHPTSETEFFIVEADAQFTFQKDATGQINQLTIRQGAQTSIAQKAK